MIDPIPEDAPPAEAIPHLAEEAPADAEDDEDSPDFGPPFERRSFGAELVWAKAPGYEAKILRIRAQQHVVVSTRGRVDMRVMLTGGRAVLEVFTGGELDRVELMPAIAVSIEADRDYRLLALTEVEIFTIFTALPS